MAQTINVNTTPGQFMPTLYYSQGDIGREFEIVLASSDGWSIPAGSTVEMVATKPSGLGFTVSGTLSGNVASFVTTETMTNEWGRYPAEIRIKSGTDVIGTANFYLNGERNPHPDGTTDGDAESLIPELTVLVERVEAAAASVLDMTVVAETLPAGSDATYSYDEETNTATFGIPRGRDGIDGEVTFDALNGATAVQSVSDSTPYLVRQTNEGNAGHNEYDEVIGGTVAWNQLVQNGNFASTSNWLNNSVTFSASNNEATYTATSDGNRFLYQAMPMVTGHKYFYTGTFKVSSVPSSAEVLTVYFGDASHSKAHTITQANVWTTFANIFSCVAETEKTLRLNARSASVTYNAKNVMFFDLTQMFGSTIADYIYSLETATAGAGVAWFKKLFNKPYYAYNAGELKSVSGLVSHDMTGFNQLDADWRTGSVNSSGVIEANNRAMVNNKLTPVLPNTTYYVKPNSLPFTTASLIACHIFDADGNYLGYRTASVNGATFTTHDNGYFLRLQINATSEITNYDLSKSEVCLNISWDNSRNGEYEPYVKHSYPLDNVTLRGIPKLDANNSLYYDGDTYESDGTVTRKYGIVDLGTLSWSKETDRNRFHTSQLSSVIKPSAFTTVVANIICSKYRASSDNDTYGQNNGISVSTLGAVYVYDSTLASGDVTAFETAMNGVYLVYELATPTTETADAYQHAQVCDPYGTEEYVSTSIVPVGHNTEYPKTLSDIKPTANGNYVLKCTVTNGTATYEWVSA